jgi:hypothetical protein
MFHDPVRVAGQINADYFTFAVDMLRKAFPNPEIAKLAALEWEMVGNQMTPVALTDQVPTLSFASLGRREGSGIKGLNPAVLVPMNWHEMCNENPIYQLGAVVFVGSQIRDYYNEKIFEREVVARSFAYEAEYLITMREIIGELKTNAYQDKVLKNYPAGLASLPPGVQYQSKPWVKGETSGAFTPPIDPTAN